MGSEYIEIYRYVNVSANRRSFESPQFWRNARICMHPSKWK